MVTARQPAAFQPSLPPAPAFQESCRDLALSYPLSSLRFYPRESWEKRSDLPTDTFKRKWRQWVQGGTTGQQPKTEETRILVSEPWAQIQAFLFLLPHHR